MKISLKTEAFYSNKGYESAVYSIIIPYMVTSTTLNLFMFLDTEEFKLAKIIATIINFILFLSGTLYIAAYNKFNKEAKKDDKTEDTSVKNKSKDNSIKDIKESN